MVLPLKRDHGKRDEAAFLFDWNREIHVYVNFYACWHLQELENQVQDLSQQVNSSSESVRIRELETERKLAEERIAELESQLQLAPTSPGQLHVALLITVGHSCSASFWGILCHCQGETSV